MLDSVQWSSEKIMLHQNLESRMTIKESHPALEVRRGLSSGAPVIWKHKYRLAAIFLAAFVTPAKADPSGLWREKDGGTVRVSRCGGGYCAFIASVMPATDAATGKRRTDSNNPDAAKRNRPLVGVQVLFAMKPSGDKRWSGRLYDSDRGQTFSGHLIEVDASTIRIEGCAMGLCGGEALSRVR